MKLLLTNLEGIASNKKISVCIDYMPELALTNYSTLNPAVRVSDTNLCYVIYTSGSTGNPKGVMIERAAFTNFLHSFISKYFSHLDRISTLSITNYVFDIFGLEYGLPLMTGGTLSFAKLEDETFDCKSVDFIQLTPSIYWLIKDRLITNHKTRLLIGGEALTPTILDKALLQFDEVINCYGPTEATIWSHSKAYHAQDNQITIGTPLGNVCSYILDNDFNQLPIGLPGELYIGGKGLARGYLT
jgi:non-ribosomal peptide synthetase component F